MNSPRRAKRQGFLLITVLVMIAVAGLMLSRLATKSLRVALTAALEEREARIRWSKISLRRLALNDSAGMLEADGEQRGIAVENFRTGGERWRVIVSDESAKLNLRQLAQEATGDQLRP